MKITDFAEKLSTIRRFRAAKNTAGKFYSGINMPDRVELRIDGKEYSFNLVASESLALLVEFPSCGQIEEIVNKP